MKKLLSLFLALIMLCLTFVPVNASGAVNASVYNVYGNNMLFEQLETATIGGTAKPGSEIKAELILNGVVVTSGTAVAGSDSEFAVSFSAPEGGYTEYEIALYCGENEFDRLTGVVFGELWLASGQSNMQLGLNATDEGSVWAGQGKKLSDNIRLLYIPALSSFGGEVRTPVDLQRNIEGAKWFKGSDSGFYNISGVAYFFAAKLQQELDMPVGIINNPLGGSTIRAWLSREDIDNTPEVLSVINSHNDYITREEWDENNGSQITDMTSDYNTKVYPIRNFKIKGMIWYQGESEVMLGYSPKEYEALFDLLQSSYSKLFGFESSMPVIYTQLASYHYGSKVGLEQMNAGFAEMQKAKADSRAVVAIYDVPLDYKAESGSIHPIVKRPVGDKMEYAAMSLVYGANHPSSAPAAVKSEIKDGSVYVTFSNVGNGLAFKGSLPQCFAVAGENGVFVKADAEITAPDTVRIYSESVPSPAYASYAYMPAPYSANLYATDENGLALCACGFVTAEPENADYWLDESWTECEAVQAWHIAENEEQNGLYDLWQGENCEAVYSPDAAYSGENGLCVTGNGDFSVSTVRTYKANKKVKLFSDIKADFTSYGTMKAQIKNNGSEPVVLKAVKFSVNNAGKWFAPEVNSSGNPDTVIPADGEWHTVSFDLNTLYKRGNECGRIYSDNSLENVTGIGFEFSGNGTICLDSLEFEAETQNLSGRYKNNLKNADNIFEYIVGFFSAVLSVFFK